jgi:hypothetical protein
MGEGYIAGKEGVSGGCEAFYGHEKFPGKVVLIVFVFIADKVFAVGDLFFDEAKGVVGVFAVMGAGMGVLADAGEAQGEQ